LGTQCLLRLDVFCPKGGSSFGVCQLTTQSLYKTSTEDA